MIRRGATHGITPGATVSVIARLAVEFEPEAIAENLSPNFMAN